MVFPVIYSGTNNEYNKLLIVVGGNMGLIKCPECGREISDRAPVCICCGITKEDIQTLLTEKSETSGEITKEDTQIIFADQNMDKANTLEDGMNRKTEYIRYATISGITAIDRKKYINKNMIRSKKICEICGIEYYSNISEKCPLCEMKRIFSESLEKEKSKTGALIDNSLENILQHRITYNYGDVIKFGRYVGQSIEWIAIKIENDKVLLISKYILDAVPYNKEYEDVTWEKSSLRRYLNNEFLENSFSKNEKIAIENVAIKNKENNEYKTPGGNETLDRVFCLSEEEVNDYLQDKIAIPIEYAKEGVSEDKMKYFVSKSSGGGCWWLRSTGCNAHRGMYVDGLGNVNIRGNLVNNGMVGIRPALWLNVKTNILNTMITQD